MLVRLARAHEYRYPELALLTAIPNGGHRNIVVATKLRAEGVRPGFPDLVLPVARGGFFGLFVELKRLRGGSVSPEQRQWHEQLESHGYCVRVCKGGDAAWDILRWYLTLPVTEAVRLSSPV